MKRNEVDSNRFPSGNLVDIGVTFFKIWLVYICLCLLAAVAIIAIIWHLLAKYW